MAETFTPLFDEITQKYGIVTSGVYGYIWRKCQGERGVCDASFQTIADDLGVSRRTIVTHVKLLVSDGLIKDLTPDADRKPHKYIPQSREINSLDAVADNSLDGRTRENNSPQLGKQMQQTREINAPKDTIQENIYIHPLPEPIQELITSIAQTVKTGYGPKTEDDFEDVAYMLMGWDVKPDQVKGFSGWWEKNGYYSGRPALKSLSDEFRNYLDGTRIEKSVNGRSPTHAQTTPAPAGRTPTQAEMDAVQAMISRGLG